jgi:hypothetical protein
MFVYLICFVIILNNCRIQSDIGLKCDFPNVGVSLTNNTFVDHTILTHNISPGPVQLLFLNFNTFTSESDTYIHLLTLSLSL